MIKQYINERMKPAEDKLIADSDEVMQFFTASMRGNVKDQFGLDPSLSDRISAAKELAKRTIDIEAKKGNADVIANMKTVADLIMCGVENRKIDDYE
jgi:phage terminase small subunit